MKKKVKNCTRDCRLKIFYFFCGETLKSVVTSTTKFNLFVADCMPEWRVTGYEKSKTLSVADCIPEFSVSALKKVKFLWSTITYLDSPFGL